MIHNNSPNHSWTTHVHNNFAVKLEIRDWKTACIFQLSSIRFESRNQTIQGLSGAHSYFAISKFTPNVPRNTPFKYIVHNGGSLWSEFIIIFFLFGIPCSFLGMSSVIDNYSDIDGK